MGRGAGAAGKPHPPRTGVGVHLSVPPQTARAGATATGPVRCRAVRHHRRILSPLASAALLLAAAGAAPAAASAANRAFLTPSGNLGCQITDGAAGLPNEVFCQSDRRPQTVRMGLGGRLRICRGVACLGDPAEDTPTVGYGAIVTAGRFRCTVRTDGVRCRVRTTGRGFLINRDTIRRIG